jgi:transcriptional regulator GlxA family with amidase domain
MFTRAMGVSPGRHVSRMRLEKTMVDIAAGKLSLADIAQKRVFHRKQVLQRLFIV